MTIKEKVDLVRLLNIYKNEQLENLNRCVNAGMYVGGLKSQFERTRIICARLERDIGKIIDPFSWIRENGRNNAQKERERMEQELEAWKEKMR